MLYDEFDAVYSLTEKEVAKRWLFEEGVRRPYFHCKPLGLYAVFRLWEDLVFVTRRCEIFCCACVLCARMDSLCCTALLDYYLVSLRLQTRRS